LRIATGGIIHETSTCVDTQTTLDDFEHDRGIIRGHAILQRFRGANVQTGGFIAAADEYGFDLVPLLRASAFPGGLIRREDYDALKAELIERLEAVGPVDGVLLDLHGAMVVDGIDDGDGDVIAAVRNVVGPDVPIGVPQDCTATIRSGELKLRMRLWAMTPFPTSTWQKGARKPGRLSC
jgi:microcystin degradation protein MlrC